MFADGYLVGDGSWELRIFVTNLKVERSLRVKGDLHVGGVMFKLVEDLDVANDWSDHALWWPQKNQWLTRTRSTLDQYGVQADALLHFTPMHKSLRIQLPDLRVVDQKVDLSAKTFEAVVSLCKELGIRYPEELSLMRPLSQDHLRKNCKIVGPTPRQRNREQVMKSINANESLNESDQYRHNLFNNTTTSMDGKSTPGLYDTFDGRTNTPTHRINSNQSTMSQHNHPNHTLRNNSPHPNATNGSNPNMTHGTLGSTGSNKYPTSRSTPTPMLSGPLEDMTYSSYYGLNSSPKPNLEMTPVSPVEGKATLLRPRSLVEKARMHASWLDSSLSLYEQDVREFDLLMLRFKFYSLYDLNPALDQARLNQVYEQARWSLLSEETECTDNEMMMFAALQLQVHLQSMAPKSPEREELTLDITRPGGHNDQDIEQALNELQAQLEGTTISKKGTNGHSSHRSDINQRPFVRDTSISTSSAGRFITDPELGDILRVTKPRRFHMKFTKKMFCCLREGTLSCYKSKEDRSTGEAPIMVIPLRGCEVTPDVNLSQLRYGLKLEVPSKEGSFSDGGMTEYNLRFSGEEQYAKWLAGIRLGTKGKTMADSGYEGDVRQILDFLSIQHPAPVAVYSPHQINVNPDDYVAPRVLRKLKSRSHTVQRILEAHANVKDLGVVEAKMQLVKGWQSLPDFGVTLFVVRFHGSKKEELLGVAANKLMRLDLTSGDHMKTWRFNTMKAWNVNWEIKQMLVQFEEEDVKFSVLSADCKVVHEFIGGYIFCSMRSKEANQSLNQDLFHKLTDGWS